uniref:Nodulin-like domain-containing protein n=1 Tax=Brassica campestris TaxID=3711 RepID=A0A3P6A5J4_BRACM|nr:unnamed protein product [Brassica rapa]
MAFLRSSSSYSSALKWLGFVTAVWVQSISGNNYTFSNYSSALKSLMNLNQLQLNNLSVAKDVGKAFGILAGLASDRLSTPVILLIGCFEGLLGYGVQWLVVSRTITPLADVRVPLYGRKQHDVDEHGGSSDMHTKLPAKPWSGLRYLERIRRPKHCYFHRSMHRFVLKRSGVVSRFTRRRAFRCLSHGGFLPPRDPSSFFRRRGERRDSLLRRVQHRSGCSRCLPSVLRHHRSQDRSVLSHFRLYTSLPLVLSHRYTFPCSHQKLEPW